MFYLYDEKVVSHALQTSHRIKWIFTEFCSWIYLGSSRKTFMYLSLYLLQLGVFQNNIYLAHSTQLFIPLSCYHSMPSLLLQKGIKHTPLEKKKK